MLNMQCVIFNKLIPVFFSVLYLSVFNDFFLLFLVKFRDKNYSALCIGKIFVIYARNS